MIEKPHILIIDDDQALLQALPQALYLRMNDLQIDTCDSAQVALEHIYDHEYDAIVSDIKMPGMDGLALLAKIQELRPQTPTLLITGHGEHSLAVEALRGGAYDFIQKPVDRDYFIAALQRAIQTHILRIQVAEQQVALEQYAQSLERKVQERTLELAKANTAKDEFISIASHELKTPLTSLKGMAQLLQKKLANSDSGNMKILAAMDSAVRRMEVLLNELLSTSYDDAGMLILHYSKCNLVKLCSRIVNEFSIGASRSLTFQVDDEGDAVEVEIDIDRISQVLINLLSNACKYSSREFPIQVTLKRVMNSCTISVSDTGVGIAPEVLPHLFERFYRAPSVEIQAGSSVGLGLGLYISQKIVQQHGGRISVESTPGMGSTFSITIPLIASAPVLNPNDISYNTTYAV